MDQATGVGRDMKENELARTNTSKSTRISSQRFGLNSLEFLIKGAMFHLGRFPVWWNESEDREGYRWGNEFHRV
jgi:hypothetical protein